MDPDGRSVIRTSGPARAGSKASLVIRWVVTLLCVAGSAGVGGCIPFEGKFAAAQRATDPHEPLSGAWVGAWTCDAGPQAHPARVVIDVAGPNTCNLWVEMSGYRNVVAEWIAATSVPVERRPDGTEHFHVKVPLESRPKEDVWAVAIQLDGEQRGNSLSIVFRTNDAMRQLDRGRFQLSRKETSPPP